MIAAGLRETVLRANRLLVDAGLVYGTFGNVSGVDHDAGVMIIKPSGVPYDELTAERMVAVSLSDGAVIDATLRPSSDTPTHLELYRAFRCGGIVHTHSESATTLAQALLPLRCMGTTHADYFRGDVPVTRALREDEVAGAYERNTGLVIIDTFRRFEVSPDEVPAVLVASHGPFVWGPDPSTAVERARALELLARIEINTRLLSPAAPPLDRFLIDRHYFRKHGAHAYYGQGTPPDV